MALKKPSDLFAKKETSGVFDYPEVSPYITESYDKFLENYETITQISEKTNVFEKIEQLSNLVELFSQNLEQKLDKTDLENAMLSQMMVLDENFKLIQNEVKGLNKKDLQEFKKTTSSLVEVVDNFLSVELPKYKNKVIKTEVFVGEQVKKLKENVEEDINTLQENIDAQFNNITEVVDNNISYFNNKLEETSFQVKETKKTYTNLSKILENKVLEENQKIEEYSKIVDNVSSAFEELSLELKEELNRQSNLTEEKFEEYKKYFEGISSSLVESINKKVIGIEESVEDKLEDYRKDLVDVRADVVINEQHIKNVDKYLKEHHQELEELKEEVFVEIEKLPIGNLQENLERLEKKIDYIKETYSQIEPEVVVKEVIEEGLLNEPPSTDNKDPLTPLDQNFVTLDQLQQHYRLFLNRIQQQLSTLGGGGETRLKYLDDIVGIATNPSAYDNKFLKYNHSLGKFEFVTVSGGAGFQTLDETLQLGNTSSLGIDVGVSTFTSAGVGTVYIGTGSEALLVDGNARITGILTIGTSSITLDGINDIITIGTGLTLTSSGSAVYSGIVTASLFDGDGSRLTGIATSGIIVGLASEGYVDAAVAGVSTFSGDYNDLINTPTIPSIVGLASEGYVDNKVAISTSGLLSSSGDGSNLTGIVTSITAGSGISIDQSTGNVTITNTGGGGSSTLGIATSGGTVGTGVTLLDFRGSGISTVTVSSGIATINIEGGGNSTTPDISSVMMSMIF